jgi:malate/lactate dehydrogenase
MSTGQVIVSLATVDSELYATFSGTMTALESSRMADFLSKSLKVESSQIFQN